MRDAKTSSRAARSLSDRLTGGSAHAIAIEVREEHQQQCEQTIETKIPAKSYESSRTPRRMHADTEDRSVGTQAPHRLPLPVRGSVRVRAADCMAIRNAARHFALSLS